MLVEAISHVVQGAAVPTRTLCAMWRTIQLDENGAFGSPKKSKSTVGSLALTVGILALLGSRSASAGAIVVIVTVFVTVWPSSVDVVVVVVVCEAREAERRSYRAGTNFSHKSHP